MISSVYLSSSKFHAKTCAYFHSFADPEFTFIDDSDSNTSKFEIQKRFTIRYGMSNFEHLKEFVKN